MGDVTQLIARARAGDCSALDALFELRYPDLRRIAHARLSGHARSQQIETMALVNEGHLKFVQMARLHPVDRNHFLAYSATVMRSIIVNTVRASQAERRGGGVRLATLSTSVGEQDAVAEDEVLDMHAGAAGLGGARRAAGPGVGDALLLRHERRGERCLPRRDRPDRAARLGKSTPAVGRRPAVLSGRSRPQQSMKQFNTPAPDWPALSALKAQLSLGSHQEGARRAR